MRGFAPSQGYVVDSSSLIQFAEVYPTEVFPSLWQRFEETIGRQGRIRSPTHVLDELNVVTDELAVWASKRSSTLFIPEDGDLIDRARVILAAHPRLVDPSSTIPEADPFVIALADRLHWTVVTQEHTSQPGQKKEKIPNVCLSAKIPCLDLLGLFKQEGWKV